MDLARQEFKVYSVLVQPLGISVSIDEETTVKRALHSQNIILKSSCGGQGACGQCIIRVLAGEENLNTPSFKELSLLGNVFHVTKERLACQLMVKGDIEIDVSDHIEEETDEQKPTLRTHVRKKEEVGQMYEERQKRRDEKQQERDSSAAKKHWEEEKDSSREKKLGGNKRPKAFKYDPKKD